MEPERIAHLLFKHVKGSLTAAEDRELGGWRELSDSNGEMFRKLTDPQYIRKTIGELDYYRDSNWNRRGGEVADASFHIPARTTWIFPAVMAVFALMLAGGMLAALTRPLISRHAPVRSLSHHQRNTTDSLRLIHFR